MTPMLLSPSTARFHSLVSLKLGLGGAWQQVRTSHPADPHGLVMMLWPSGRSPGWCAVVIRRVGSNRRVNADACISWPTP